jgi:hypothetical protein
MVMAGVLAALTMAAPVSAQSSQTMSGAGSSGSSSAQGDGASPNGTSAMVPPAATAAPVGPGYDQTSVPTTPAPPTIDQPDARANSVNAARALTPTPPNEFERYLMQVAGHPVPRFGANLLIPGCMISSRPPPPPSRPTMPSTSAMWWPSP